jgi:hypothetical protein
MRGIIAFPAAAVESLPKRVDEAAEGERRKEVHDFLDHGEKLSTGGGAGLSAR